MKIKSVAVLGAGAVGSYVIWGLSEKSDIRLVSSGPFSFLWEFRFQEQELGLVP